MLRQPDNSPRQRQGERSMPPWNQMQTTFLADLADAGSPATSTPSFAPISMSTMWAGTPCWSTALGPDLSQRPLSDGPHRIQYWGAKRGRQTAVSSPIRSTRCLTPACRSGRDRPPGLRRNQPRFNPRPYPWPCQLTDRLGGRGGADHRRLHAPPLPDRAARLVVDRRFRSGGGRQTASGC